MDTSMKSFAWLTGSARLDRFGKRDLALLQCHATRVGRHDAGFIDRRDGARAFFYVLGCGEKPADYGLRTRGPNTVCAAVELAVTISSVVSLRISASAAAVCATKAGSLRFPRCGTGAR